MRRCGTDMLGKPINDQSIPLSGIPQVGPKRPMAIANSVLARVLNKNVFENPAFAGHGMVWWKIFVCLKMGSMKIPRDPSKFSWKISTETDGFWGTLINFERHRSSETKKNRLIN